MPSFLLRVISTIAGVIFCATGILTIVFVVLITTVFKSEMPSSLGEWLYFLLVVGILILGFFLVGGIGVQFGITGKSNLSEWITRRFKSQPKDLRITKSKQEIIDEQ